MIDIGDDFALFNRDIRTGDVVAMLIADEHGFFARIAPTAAATLTIRICFVQFHKAAILRAVKLDVIIRRTHTRDNGV